MKFRQRVAWLLLVLYFAASFSILYYTFEINDHYNNLALDHHNTYHREKNEQKTHALDTLWHHLTDIPLPVWLMLLLLPYLQIFGMLLAWTRTEPRMSFAYMWPGIVYMHVQKTWKSCDGRHVHVSKPINSAFVRNGHVIIDT